MSADLIPTHRVSGAHSINPFQVIIMDEYHVTVRYPLHALCSDRASIDSKDKIQGL